MSVFEKVIYRASTKIIYIAVCDYCFQIWLFPNSNKLCETIIFKISFYAYHAAVLQCLQCLCVLTILCHILYVYNFSLMWLRLLLSVFSYWVRFPIKISSEGRLFETCYCTISVFSNLWNNVSVFLMIKLVHWGSRVFAVI